MRPSVDRERIEAFLQALGGEVGAPARLYLVGGATMVLLGLRPRTIDIDLSIEVEDRHHAAVIDAVRRLKDRLQVNVEEASPADFIPLPSGHESRAIWVARYGTIDVFHFDLVSAALSKLERGHAVDFEDAVQLVRSGHVALDALQRGLEEILPRMASASLKQDPERMRRNYDAFLKRLGAGA